MLKPSLPNSDALTAHYARILAQNREILLQGGRGDLFLQSKETDTRRAVALLIRVKGGVCEKISEYIQTLKQTEPELYYYPPQDFHITVLDILRGKENRMIPENVDEYISCIKGCTDGVKPFCIEFKGVTASDNAVLVCGYYEDGLEELRHTIREALSERNLILDERYKSISSHITIARIPEKLAQPKRFLEQIGQDVCFGTMKVDLVELTFHNWYDSEKMKLAEFRLAGENNDSSV